MVSALTDIQLVSQAGRETVRGGNGFLRPRWLQAGGWEPKERTHVSAVSPLMPDADAYVSVCNIKGHNWLRCCMGHSSIMTRSDEEIERKVREGKRRQM